MRGSSRMRSAAETPKSKTRFRAPSIPAMATHCGGEASCLGLAAGRLGISPASKQLSRRNFYLHFVLDLALVPLDSLLQAFLECHERSVVECLLSLSGVGERVTHVAAAFCGVCGLHAATYDLLQQRVKLVQAEAPAGGDVKGTTTGFVARRLAGQQVG